MNLILPLLLLPMALGAVEPAITIKVFSEITYDVDHDGFWGKNRISGSVISSGSAYLVSVNGTIYVITAAHVVKGPAWDHIGSIKIKDEDGQQKEITLNPQTKDKVISSQSRIRISHSSIPPRRLLVDADNDLAVMELWPENYSVIGARRFTIGSELPHIGDGVTIWGYPAGPRAQASDILTVTEMSVAGLITLNKTIESGYSGGPIVNQRNELMGTVQRANHRQSFGTSNRVLSAILNRFASMAIPYTESKK